MGRRVAGFATGLAVSALVFAVIAIQSSGRDRDAGTAPPAPAPATAAATPDPAPTPAPDPAPTQAPAPDPEPDALPAPVTDAAPAPDPAPRATEAPAPQPAPARIAPPQPDPAPPAPDPAQEPPARPTPARATPDADPAPVADQAAAAPMPDADPAPMPDQTAPDPRAEADPDPAPDRETLAVAAPARDPQDSDAPAPDPAIATEAEPDPAVPPAQAAQDPPAEDAAAAPPVRRARLPVVSDDPARSAGIRIGRPATSELPSVTGPATGPSAVPGNDPDVAAAVPGDTPVPAAPAPTGPKRLVAPNAKALRSDRVAILSAAPEAPPAAADRPRAIDRYGVLFEPGGRPMMSIILVDVGHAGVTLNAAATLDLPVSFAVAVDRDDAARAAAAYYDHGHEVLALSPRSVELSLSGGQSDAQVADLLQRFFTLMPQTVGLLDVPEATFQNDPVLAQQVLAALHDSGRGLVTYAQGLNAVRREADKAGVPAGLIFRALDAGGESPAAIARHLDRAAAEASRSGHVLVIGTTRADTIQAIRDWADSRAARAVALAPVSASLKADE